MVTLNHLISRLRRWFQRDTDWRGDLRDGKFVMKRRINGEWVYREPTPAEAEEDEWWQAIR